MSLSETLSGQPLHPVLDSLVTNCWDSIMVTEASQGTPIVYVNDAFTKLTGYPAAEVLGKSPALLQGPKTDQGVLDRLRQDLAAGRVFEGEAINYRRDCSEFKMVWRVFPVNDQNGSPLYFIALQKAGHA